MILLDTHVVIWLAQEPQLLSQPAREAIRIARQGDGVAISDKTLWEIAKIESDKDILVRTSLLDFLEVCSRTFHVLPITPSVAMQSVQFSDRFPKDPTDRIIAATASVHKIPLVTKDAKIRKSGEVRCIW